MIKGIYASVSGMISRSVQMENIANNLANISTPGFKKSNVFLRRLITANNALDNIMGREPREVPEEIWTDFSQSTFDETHNPFDFALNGPGFLRVRDNAGNVYYTRNGNFHKDAGNFLVNTSGMFLLDDAGAVISIEGYEVGVLESGEVFVDGESVATIGIVDFDQNGYPALKGVGMELFVKPATVNEIPTRTGTQLLQGFLEDSNVNLVYTMVDLIETFRSFETGQKAIQIQDQSLQRVVTEVGVVR